MGQCAESEVFPYLQIFSKHITSGYNSLSRRYSHLHVASFLVKIGYRANCCTRIKYTGENQELRIAMNKV